VHLTDMAERERWQDRHIADFEETLAATEISRMPSGEMVAGLIDSRLNNKPRDYPVNIANAGQCPDLPNDVVVESMCTVDSSGLRGRDRAVLPPVLADTVRRLRTYGWRTRDNSELKGLNSRLDELQAAILRVLLPELDAWSAGRRDAGRAYGTAGLDQHVGMPTIPDGADPAWHLYVVTHARADALLAGLNEQGVQARAYYRTPLHRQKAMAPYAHAGLALPATDELAPALRGAIITAESPDYDEARAVYNGMINRRPAVIARCR